MSGRIAGKVAIDAIGRAVGREGPPDDGSLAFHGDQGARHASHSFQRCLDSHGIIQSVSRPGTPLDNAAAEPFLKTPKRESAEERSYGTRDEAKQDIFKHIELYCNRARMHPALDCMSPVEYERQYARGSLKESPVYPSHSNLVQLFVRTPVRNEFLKLSQLLSPRPTKRNVVSFDGTRSVAAPKTGRNWNDGTAELGPSSGNS